MPSAIPFSTFSSGKLTISEINSYKHRLEWPRRFLVECRETQTRVATKPIGGKEKYHYEQMETQSEARENACNRVAGSLT